MGDEPVLPSELITSVKHSMLHAIECDEIASEEDLEHLIRFMFEFSERDFFLYCPLSNGANQFVLDAEFRGVLTIELTEMRYYPHPNFQHDYVKIDRTEPLWDWEREVRETSPEFVRCTLKLTERWRRKLELQEALADQEEKKEPENPLILKPSMFGLGLDLPKALKWFQRWKNNNPKK
ncbi:hypothetical protein [Denitrificimonas caeni]|uniref:hypothetical protein n=1 Tax=Denitrificimonas caeni TaxID=521720 RepID=UPI001963AA84|nr:hypothetical protein [Denitrificimonas caeni]